MPDVPRPPLAPRRKSRQIMVGKGSTRSRSAATRPVSVQSMTHHADRRRQRHAAADRRADRVRLPDRPGRRARRQDDADALPTIAQQVADPGDRRHPLPAEVRLRRDRRRLRGGAGEPRQHQASSTTRSARSPRPPRTPASRSGSASTPARWTSGCWRSTARPRPEALVESALWECSLFEEHGFRDIKISVKHNDPVVMVAAYRQLAAAVRLPAAPRRDRGRPGVPGHDQVGGRVRRAAGRGHRRHHPGVAVGAAGRGGQGRHRRSWSRSNLRQRGLEIVSCPSCGRAQVDVYTLADEVTAGARGHGRAAAGRRHGLRRQRPGRGPRGRPRRRVRQRQGPDLRQGRGHQDRARVADRRDADRGGDEAGRDR